MLGWHVCAGGAGFAAVVPGHVEGWGQDFFGQASPDPNLDGVIDVAAGGDFSLALLTNGFVVGWGANHSGQTDIPQGLNEVVAVAAASHGAALRRNGTVTAWGSTSEIVTNVPAGLNDVKMISVGNLAGNSYTLAVRSNGTVAAWGLNSVTNVPADLPAVRAVAAGTSHALALLEDGSVMGWGENHVGQATPPPGLSGVVAVRAGQFSSLALKSDGTVVKWGSFANVPVGLSGVVDVELGANHAVALCSNGLVVAWGENSSGQGVAPAGLNGVTAIAAGGNHNLAVTARPVIRAITPPVVANPGDTVTFTVDVTGGPLRYQWRHNGAELPAATNASLVLNQVQADDAGSYTVRVSNPFGNTPSPATALSFPPPMILSEPASMTRYRSQTALVSVTASGLEPLTYQWFKNGVGVAGATEAALTLLNLGFADAGTYHVVVTDAAGSRRSSEEAVLTVIDPTRPVSTVLEQPIDTSLHSSQSNPQGDLSILAGTRRNGIVDRGLLRFDLGSIPAQAAIQSAELRLGVTKIPRFAANSNFQLHRMLSPWGADVTWTEATAGVPWAAPGGLAGADFRELPSAMRFVSGLGVYAFESTEQTVDDVRDWLRDPASNHGWMLKTENEEVTSTARHFGSGESAQPPQLLLNYAPPAPAARLTESRVGGESFILSFQAEAGWLYRVEGRKDAGNGDWMTMTNVLAGPGGTVVVAVPLNDSRQFYRVLTE